MSRALLALMVACLVASAAHAGPITIGVRGGWSIPDLRNSGNNPISTGWSSRVAPFGGVWVDDRIAPSWSLEVEANLAPQGGKRDGMQPLDNATSLGLPPGTTAWANYSQEARLDYVEVPVMAMWHLRGPGDLHLGAGPYAGFLVSADTRTSGTSAIFLDQGGTQQAAPPESFDATTDAKSGLKSFNWGMQFGAGASQPWMGGLVTFDVRAGLGLADIQKDAVDGKNTTGNLVVALGYGHRVGMPL